MFEDLIPPPGMFDDLVPAADVPATATVDRSAGIRAPTDAGKRKSEPDATGATSSIPRLVGEAFGAGPILDLLDPGVLSRGWEGVKQGFGSEPIGFSDENRRNYPRTYLTWQPFVAPIDTALRLPGAIVGGAAGLGAGIYQAHGGGKAEADRLERDLNILGQGALIESGMRPPHRGTVPGRNPAAGPSGSGGQPGLRPATDLRSPLSPRHVGEGAEPARNMGPSAIDVTPAVDDALDGQKPAPGPTRSAPPGSDNSGSPPSDNRFESAPSPEPPSQQQIADNRAKIADFVTRVGIPLDRIGSIEIDAVARRMESLPLPDAIGRTALRNALEGDVVSPGEVDWIYGPGAADEVRGASTPANGPADPAQGRAPGQSAAHVAEGQPVPRPGEDGGKTSTRAPVRSGDTATPISENGEYQPRNTPSRHEEPAGPAQTIRPAGIGPDSDPLNRSVEQDGARNTGPPPDQSRVSDDGAPSGAVFVSGDHEASPPAGATPANGDESGSATQRLLKLPAHRFAGRPKERGAPPIGDDGHPVERHHHGQVHDGMIEEMTRTDHRLGENYKINHHNTGQTPSQIDPARARRESYEAWAKDWDQGLFDHLPELSEPQKKRLQVAARARLRAPAKARGRKRKQ